MPNMPGGSASAPERAAARVAALRARARAAAAGEGTALSRDSGTAETRSSRTSTTVLSAGAANDEVVDKVRPTSVLLMRMYRNLQYTGYNRRPNTRAGCRMLAMPILEYELLPPTYIEYDPAVIAVANRVISLVESAAPSVTVAKKLDYPRLGALLPLRRAIAAGTGSVDAASHQVPVKGLAHEVAALWKAQADLQQLRVDDVAGTLRARKGASSLAIESRASVRLVTARVHELVEFSLVLGHP